MWPRAAGYWFVSLRSQWRSFAAYSLVSPLLYLAGLGFGLGALVDTVDVAVSGGANLSGSGTVAIGYAAFVAPGVMAATAMTTAYGESSWTVLGAVKWKRLYEAQLATPLRVADVLTGHAVVIATRVAVSSTAFAAVMAALGLMDVATGALTVPAAVLTGLAFSLATMAYASRVASDQALVVVLRFVIAPLFLIGGTFVPVDRLPVVLQVVVWVTPLWHGVELCRDASLAMVALPWWAVAGHIVYLLLWVVAGWYLALRGYRRRLT